MLKADSCLLAEYRMKDIPAFGGPSVLRGYDHE